MRYNNGNRIVFRTGPGRLEYRCQSCTADIVVRGAYQGMRRSKSPTLVKRYTRRTSKVANFRVNGFIHLRLLRRDPFEPPGLRADFRLGSPRQAIWRRPGITSRLPVTQAEPATATSLHR